MDISSYKRSTLILQAINLQKGLAIAIGWLKSIGLFCKLEIIFWESLICLERDFLNGRQLNICKQRHLLGDLVISNLTQICASFTIYELLFPLKKRNHILICLERFFWMEDNSTYANIHLLGDHVISNSTHFCASFTICELLLNHARLLLVYYFIVVYICSIFLPLLLQIKNE